MYLLDTNVLSEVVKPVPNASVVAKLSSKRREDLFASAITRLELRYGAQVAAKPTELWGKIEHGILPVVQWLDVTSAVAEQAGDIAAALRRIGREAKNYSDPLLAATALVHDLTLVTRNVRDFEQISELRVEDWFDEG